MTDPSDVRFKSDGNVAIHVTDLERARDFYGRTLGFRLVEERPEQLVFDTGALTLFVNQDDVVRPFVPALAVPSYDEAKDQLLAGGCRILREWPEYRALYFEDPFGIVMDIIEKKPAAD